MPQTENHNELSYSTYDQYITLVKSDSLAAYDVFLENKNKIVDLFTTYEQYKSLVESAPLLAGDVFSQDPITIGSLITSSEEYIGIVSCNTNIAYDLFSKNPNNIVSLFNTAEQYIKLNHVNTMFALYIFQHDPDKIIRLFTKSMQYVELCKLNLSVAIDVYKHAPDTIANLFNTYDDYMALIQQSAIIEAIAKKLIAIVSRNTSLVEELFKKDPRKMAAVFDTSEKISHLAVLNHALAERISKLQNIPFEVSTLKSVPKQIVTVPPEQSVTRPLQTNHTLPFKDHAVIEKPAAEQTQTVSTNKISQDQILHSHQPVLEQNHPVVKQPAADKIQVAPNQAATILPPNVEKKTLARSRRRTEIKKDIGLQKKDSSCASISLMVLGGFMAVAGVTLAALAFTFLNAGACIAGVVVSGALALKGLGLFVKGYQPIVTNTSPNESVVSFNNKYQSKY